jgi:RNA-splicing ligase RtcB
VSDLPNPDKSSEWLEGDEATQYLIDMVFCQLYAVENRTMMGETVADVLNTTITDEIHSIHNFIDFRDQIIRKGATRAYEGERSVIPFNMRDGSVIVKGKSNPEWNHSVSHGTGRQMSRGQARDITTEDELATELEASDVYAGETPPSESPVAYKDAAMIQQAITDTATITEHLTPIHNFKANN